MLSLVQPPQTLTLRALAEGVTCTHPFPLLGSPGCQPQTNWAAGDKGTDDREPPLGMMAGAGDPDSTGGWVGLLGGLTRPRGSRTPGEVVEG